MSPNSNWWQGLSSTELKGTIVLLVFIKEAAWILPAQSGEQLQSSLQDAADPPLSGLADPELSSAPVWR